MRCLVGFVLSTLVACGGTPAHCRSRGSALPGDASVSEQLGIGACCATMADCSSSALCVPGACCWQQDSGRHCQAASDCCSGSCVGLGDPAQPLGGICARYDGPSS
jgi:hypothetical protein